jgi:hypothetical protein
MFAAFPVMRQLHEMLWYLARALELPEAAPVHGALGEARAEVERLRATVAELVIRSATREAQRD